MDWQPIGTESDNVPLLVCRFEPGYRCDYVLSPVSAKRFTSPGEPDVWEFYFDSEPIPATFLPTHWQYLPQPPTK